MMLQPKHELTLKAPTPREKADIDSLIAKVPNVRAFQHRLDATHLVKCLSNILDKGAAVKLLSPFILL